MIRISHPSTDGMVIGDKEYKHGNDMMNAVLPKFMIKGSLTAKENRPEKALLDGLLRLDSGRRLHLGKRNGLAFLLEHNAHQALQYIIHQIYGGKKMKNIGKRRELRMNEVVEGPGIFELLEWGF